MLFLFLVAGLLTLILGIVPVGSLVAGIVLCFVRRLRVAAPFVLLVPSLAAFGALIGSWGLGYVADQHYPMSALPLWAWIFGLPAGALLGFLLGVLLALLITLLTRGRFTPHESRLEPAITPNA
jgi:ABC-type Fe3+-siderophore transport system permease subunit